MRYFRAICSGSLLPIPVLYVFLQSAAVTTPATAAPVQETVIDQIRVTAAEFARLHVAPEIDTTGIEINRMDPRLNLPRCDQPLTGYLPPGRKLQGNTIIGVSCDGSHPWKVYVPVTIRQYRMVVVTAHRVSNDRGLNEADLVIEKQDISAMTDAPISVPGDAIGLLPRRPLPAGTVLTARLLEAPRLVRRGQQVSIIASGPGLQISAAGEALSDGARGEMIRVRNLLTKKEISAVVTEYGLVQIRLDAYGYPH